METPATTPYTTMVIDGGITMPTVPPEATQPAAKVRS